MPTNYAAWIPSQKSKFQVKEAPYPKPGPNEVVIKNGAVAINPVDWIMQDLGTGMGFSWIKYPFIFGHDVAGEIVQVGNNVTRFSPGDRVVGQAMASDKKVNSAAHGAFQLYTVLLECNTASIPGTLTYEEAAGMPLGFATAAAGLFQKDQLALSIPSLDPKPNGKTLIVWGGSTSVGCNAIQLGVAAGYEVVTTSSPKNFELLHSLGATKVFDYNDPKTVANITRYMQGKQCAGALAIGENSMFYCLDILGQCEGNRHLAMATFPIPAKPKGFVLLQIIYSLITSMISITIKSKMRGIKTSFVMADVIHTPLGDTLYSDFLPKALQTGKFRAAPEPLVAGNGLEMIQDAIALQKEGVSAKKVVVTLK